jgi:hypothetical protein
MGNTLPTKPHLTYDTAQKIIADQQLAITQIQNLIDTKTIIQNKRQPRTTAQFMPQNTPSNTPPNIPPSPTVTEPFTNIDAITLNPENYPEVSDYANIYNNNIALINDPNNMERTAFTTYINIQNKKINKLRDELIQLQNNMVHSTNTIDVKAYKNMSNSQILNIELYKELTPNDHRDHRNHLNAVNGASTYPNFLIYGNNGCLEYTPGELYTSNNSMSPPSWSFNVCNANNPKQQFISTQINDKDTYNSYINNDANKSNKINTANNTLFGFNVITPIYNEINDNQCLQLNSDGLSVMPCTLDFDQRFKPIYNTVLP